MQKITIAIDGYSSCGKSTLAKALASKIGYSYIDTGAMYRATTFYLMQQQIITAPPFDLHNIISNLDKIHLTFQYNPALKFSETFLNGYNVERDIRDMKVSGLVSHVSLIKEVRQKMIAIQKQMGKNKGVVMEGRDIGTNVFPNAELKIFMTADIDVRVQRRYDELHSKGELVSTQLVKENLLSRDYEDTNRKENPLIKAHDAITLDNSELSRQEQLDFVLKLIEDLMLI
jgi:CMP/dCMP kinase